MRLRALALVLAPIVAVSVVAAGSAEASAAGPVVTKVLVFGDGPGDAVQVFGAGFTPGADVTMTMTGPGLDASLPTWPAQPDGSFEAGGGTRVPLSAQAGVAYRIQLAQAGLVAQSAPFTLSAPSAQLPPRLQPGHPLFADDNPALSVVMRGLDTSQDGAQSVTIDGVPVSRVWSSDNSGYIGLPVVAWTAFAVPADLPVGDHQVTFTQTGSTPYTVTGVVPVPAPTLSVGGPVPESDQQGIPVTATNLDWNGTWDVVVVGAAGDRHTSTLSSSIARAGAGTTRVGGLTGLSPGTATMTITSRANHPTATTTFTVEPDAVGAPGLAAGQRILSPSGGEQLLMQADGNLVSGQPGYHPNWSTGTMGHPGARLAVQSDGNVVVYDAQGKALWNTRTVGIGAGARVRIGQTGEVGVFTAGGRQAWSNFVDRQDGWVPTLTAGQYLFRGESMSAELNQLWNHDVMSLQVQPDGNVVLADEQPVNRTVPLWSSRTAGHPGTYLVLQTDGNLVVRAANGTTLWADYAKASGARLVLQSDGNLVEYAADGRAVWATRTARHA